MRIMVPNEQWENIKGRIANLENDVATKPDVDGGSFTIEVADWDENHQAVLENELFQTGNFIFVSEDGSEGRNNYDAVKAAQLSFEVTAAGQLTITAAATPESDIVLSIVVFAL